MELNRNMRIIGIKCSSPNQFQDNLLVLANLSSWIKLRIPWNLRMGRLKELVFQENEWIRYVSIESYNHIKFKKFWYSKISVSGLVDRVTLRTLFIYLNEYLSLNELLYLGKTILLTIEIQFLNSFVILLSLLSLDSGISQITRLKFKKDALPLQFGSPSIFCHWTHHKTAWHSWFLWSWWRHNLHFEVSYLKLTDTL